jgi:hypothetical protein
MKTEHELGGLPIGRLTGLIIQGDGRSRIQLLSSFLKASVASVVAAKTVLTANSKI